jgi:hypothetical protein
MAILEVCTNSIDWVALRGQKLTILDMLYEGGHNFDTEDMSALDGILGLIDGLQDNAADLIGSMEVFGECPDDDDSEYQDFLYTQGIL